MKNFTLIFLILGLLITSCDEDSISKQEKRAAKEAAKAKKEQVDKLPVVPIETELGGELTAGEGLTITEEKVVHVTYTTVPTDSSYWYVVMKDDNTNWHGTVELATPYFDFIEAKKEFEGAVGKCYFKFILQINKETVPTFYKYND